MKHHTTIRREVKRLRGMWSRDNQTEAQRTALWRSIRTLEWVLDSTGRRWSRPADTIPEMRWRKGAP